MDLKDNKVDSVIKPISNERIAASEWNQLAGSCMEFITEAGLTPDENDNAQFLNAFKLIAANLELVGANTNLSNLTATGEAHFANPTLTNVSHTSGYRPLIEVYHNGTEWYKVFAEYDPSTGNFVGNWCEQGGHFSTTGTAAYHTVTLHKPYSNTNYNIQVSFSTTGEGYNAEFGAAYLTAANKTASSFDLRSFTDARLADKDWYACGYL